MKKLFTIYLCTSLVIMSIVLPLLLPTLAIVEYVEHGFSGIFIFIVIITILSEPLAIAGSYALLSIIKDIYKGTI